MVHFQWKEVTVADDSHMRAQNDAVLQGLGMPLGCRHKVFQDRGNCSTIPSSRHLKLVKSLSGRTRTVIKTYKVISKLQAPEIRRRVLEIDDDQLLMLVGRE